MAEVRAVRDKEARAVRDKEVRAVRDEEERACARIASVITTNRGRLPCG